MLVGPCQKPTKPLVQVHPWFEIELGVRLADVGTAPHRLVGRIAVGVIGYHVLHGPPQRFRDGFDQFQNGDLGLRVSDIPAGVVEQLELGEGVQGVMIVDVVKDSPAGKAGLRAGQVIVEIAHQKVNGKESFKELIRSHARGGETLLMRVLVKPGTVERKFLKVPEGFEAP